MSDDFTPTSAPAAFSLAARLIKCAARGAPPELAERLEEEWLADLATQPSAFAGLSFALGCCWATWVIAREHRAASARVAVSASGSKTVTLDRFRSLSMTRFRWIGIAVAALAVTALLIVAAGELAGRAFSFGLQHIDYFARPWWWLDVSFGSVLWMTMAASVYQMRVHRRRDGGPALLESRHRPPFWLLALVVFPTSALLLAASVWLGFTTTHLAGSEMRSVFWGMALFLAMVGVGLLIVLACSHRVFRRHDGGPGVPGGGLR
jgi:hypothetical protein